ncbi:DUF4249 domain-containing protein [Lacihabitans sp. LS3-19]|uniref:DUF4249 domain-containing protein n=1 Tax=Lacihabitans sp. LS3-19 TaxID=2487335 RepID=UPI0020CC4F7C|nr:DUF4249 domain-containing protein [Lacihabitans sp. LS3-19]MCP9769924.1 DUF4249 domain-containing protein [Lacihabitans sp. LS3-19]
MNRIFNILKKKIYYLFVLGTFLACVEPFEINYGSQKEILFIEADINDLDTEQFVRIRRNTPSDKNIDFFSVEKAKVQVIENETKVYDCTYAEGGKYYLPEGFLGKIGVPYKLRFELNGKTYESSNETANKVAPIEKIYSVLSPNGIIYKDKNIDGHEIYIDTKDINTDKQFYLWQWRLFEKQGYCKSCEGGRFNVNPLPLGKCVDDANLKRRGTTYDYLCNKDCWDIFYNEDVNVMSDKYANGQNITGRLIAKIPFFQFRNALIEVQQYSISQSAFEYFNILINQTQRNGSLADTPPAGLIGNVKNINDSTEPIGGVFMVSSKASKTFVINRTEMSAGIKAIGFTNGRPITPEPSAISPPAAPCIASQNRTDKKPLGWVE